MRKYISFTILGGVLILALVAVIAITFPQVAASSPIPFVSTPGGLGEIMPPDSPPGTSAEQAPLLQTAGTYVWSYSAKFVCGYQPPFASTQPGEPPVKPGNYATEINIHNYNFKSLVVKKFIIVLVDPQNGPIGREPNDQLPRTSVTVPMRVNAAMMDDCNALWTMAFGGSLPPGNPTPLTVGYLVILSPLDLNIDTVYTAEVPGTQATTPSGISINVTRVAGKRVFAPTGTYP